MADKEIKKRQRKQKIVLKDASKESEGESTDADGEGNLFQSQRYILFVVVMFFF